MIDESKLNELNFAKDSKLLTPKKREEFYKKIIKLADYKIVIVEPPEIDAALESQELNLNWLEAHKTAEIINELKPEEAFIDCPSPNTERYKLYLKELLKNKNVNLNVGHKMESKNFCVASASIIAKVTRDNIIEEIKKKYGEIGPGYMSNETTQKFLKENWEKHPEIFRKSWISWKNHKDHKEQKSLEEF
ncbi:ribonuclease HII [Candidatus Woesearchaeota archaeon]|nr:ribonuclease HII [Candidatus Woesearchaeota archaeon]